MIAAVAKAQGMEESRKSKLILSLDKVVTLLVGGGEGKNSAPEVKIVVHKSVPCQSPFFKAACKPEWMSAEDQIIKLPTDKVSPARVLVHWLYYQEIRLGEIADNLSNGANLSRFMLYIDVFILADKYQLMELCNAVIGALLLLVLEVAELNDPDDPAYHRKFSETIATFVAYNTYVYEHTMEGATLRSLLVQYAQLHMTKNTLLSIEEKLCQEFLVDLTVKFYKTQTYSVEKIWNNFKTQKN